MAQFLNNAIALEQGKLQLRQQNNVFIPGAVTILMFTSREITLWKIHSVLLVLVRQLPIR